MDQSGTAAEGSDFGRSESPARMSRAAAAPVAESRPGLGTKWGRERESVVSSTSFSRASSRPLGTTRIYYNELSGIGARVVPGKSQEAVCATADGLAELRVVNRWGRTLPAMATGGRITCIGEKGDRYSLKVTNHSDRRLEFVMTVDGLDVLDGRAGSLAKRGYIIAPGASYEVDGWRTSDSKVATFRFSSVDDSYASQKHGDIRNVGVVGLAVFAESGPKPRRLDSDDASLRRKADPFPGDRYATPP